MKISILEPLGIPQEELSAVLRFTIGEDVAIEFFPDRQTDAETLVARSQGAQAVVLSNFPFCREVIERCPELKLICVAFTGVDHVDLECCRERGIVVCNCAGYSTTAVADLTFGLVISLARNIPACDQRCRQGGVKDGLVGYELEGKTFGIIGTGAIGSRVAQIANAFGCRVLAYSRTQKALENVEYVSMQQLLRESDIVSLHVPQTKDTVGLIGKEELSMMKPSALLINTARGAIVNTTDLADALKTGKIAGAGIDVFDSEPPISVENPLFSAPNVICTPHVAFATRQAFEKRAWIVAKNLSAWIDGTPTNRIC